MGERGREGKRGDLNGNSALLVGGHRRPCEYNGLQTELNSFMQFTLIKLLKNTKKEILTIWCGSAVRA